jgi:hypothetical protein
MAQSTLYYGKKSLEFRSMSHMKTYFKVHKFTLKFQCKMTTSKHYWFVNQNGVKVGTLVMDIRVFIK